MDLDDTDRLRHIADAARKPLEHFDAVSLEAYAADDYTIHADVNLLTVIGETAAQLTEVGRATVPSVPWDKVIHMRHILVHRYFEIDVPVVYSTLREDVPNLLTAVEQALKSRG